MDVRAELLELRAEFKQLGSEIDSPNAQFSSRSDGFQQWYMKGNPRSWELFRGLAARAELAAGGKGNWQDWLERVSRQNGVTDTYRGHEPASDTTPRIEHWGAWVQNPAQLSVLTIDKLLVTAATPQIAAKPQDRGDAGPPVGFVPLKSVLKDVQGKYVAAHKLIKDNRVKTWKPTEESRRLYVNAAEWITAVGQSTPSDADVETFLDGVESRKASISRKPGRKARELRKK